MTVKGSYLKAAGISLLIHIILIALVSSISVPRGKITVEETPAPIEIEIVPPQLIDMENGKLILSSGGPDPPARAESSEDPEPEPEQEQLRSDYEEPVDPPSLPEVSNETSAVLPSPKNGEATLASGEGSEITAEATDKSDTGLSNTENEERYGENVGDGYTDATLKAGSLPRYPRAARREGREGVVMLRVLVGTDGIPLAVSVREGSGFEDFDNAAVKAVKEWRFSPATRDGHPVAGFHDVKVRFRLDEAV